MENVAVGQLAELIWKVDGENAHWEYCVVEHIFDNRIQLVFANGHRYMHVIDSEENEKEVLDDQPTKSNLNLLYKNGEPVMAKKKLFGGYVVKP